MKAELQKLFSDLPICYLLPEVVIEGECRRDNIARQLLVRVCDNYICDNYW